MFWKSTLFIWHQKPTARWAATMGFIHFNPILFQYPQSFLGLAGILSQP